MVYKRRRGGHSFFQFTFKAGDWRILEKKVKYYVYVLTFHTFTPCQTFYPKKTWVLGLDLDLDPNPKNPKKQIPNPNPKEPKKKTNTKPKFKPKNPPKKQIPNPKPIETQTKSSAPCF
jgi:hypothetical protein